jgi:putative ABC transport system permease protein
MKLKNSAEKNNMIGALAKTNGQYIVKETVNAGELKRMVGQITIPFSLMVIMVLFTSMFIIYSAFRVISIERLPVLGTLRSIGAGKNATGAMLFLESLFYGLIGGALGSAGGIGVLHVMTAMLSRAYMNGAKAAVVFTREQIGAAFVMAVVISILSSALPIIQISRIPVKEVILNTYSIHDGSNRKSLFSGLIFLFFSIIIPRYVSGKYGIIFYSTCIILSIIALIMLIPYITGGLAFIFETIFEKLPFNIGIMAVKNIKGNKSMLNNISLLAIGIATLLMINTVSFSLMEDITSLFRGSKFDVMMWWVTKGDRDMEMILNRIDGVDATYGIYQLSQIEADGLGVKFQQIDGVDRLKYLDYMQIDSEDNPGKLMQEMDSGRNILVTYMMKEKLGVKKGDIIRLQMKNGTKEYKVAGFFNSIIAGGSYGLIPERYAKLDGGEQYYSSIYIKTYKNPNEVVNSIKDELKKSSFRIGTLTDVENENKKSSLQMFSILKGFSIIAFAVGIIGVVNNFIISFMQRKRYLALLSSVGMSKVQGILMILIEGIIGGFIGGATGVISGILIISIIPKVMQTLNVGIEIKYSAAMFFSSILSGIVIMLGSSISSAVKSFRLNVVEAIKYE